MLRRRRRALQLLSVAILTGTSIKNANANTFLTGQPVYVIGPLGVMNDAELAEFKTQLITLKAHAPNTVAISTDLWWGVFQPRNTGVDSVDFDWTYYQKLSDIIVNQAHFYWLPILSFHQCGSGPSDPTCYIPLPSWTNSLPPTNGRADYFEYIDQNGTTDTEYLSPWADDVAAPLYERAMKSFATTFQSLANQGGIPQVHVGLGAQSELRYPSYDHPGCGYPTRGCIEAYSSSAMAAFQNAMQTKYGTIASLNAAWSTNYTTFSQVVPPGRPSAPDSVDEMYGSSLDSYARDFWTWYRQTQLDHATRVLAAAGRQLNVLFGHTASTILGLPTPGPQASGLVAKIPGVHWQFTNPTQPHGAEASAGYWFGDGTKPYQAFNQMFSSLNTYMDLTALEQAPDPNPTAFDDPQGLVDEVVAANHAAGINCCLFGENALEADLDADSFDRIALHLFNQPFDGFGLLRLSDLVDTSGNSTALMPLFTAHVASTRVSMWVTVNVSDGTLPQGDVPCLTGGTNGAAPGTGSEPELGEWIGSFCTPLKLVGDNGVTSTYASFASVSDNFNYGYKFRFVSNSLFPNPGPADWEPGSTTQAHSCMVNGNTNCPPVTWGVY
jgi:beta-amylase